MGVFDGIEKAEVFGGGSRIRPGSHIVEVGALVVHRSRKKAGIVYFVAELVIVESVGGRPVSAKPDAPPASSEPHKVDEKLGWVVDLSQPSGLANVKGFAMALAPDMDADDITSESMETLVSSDQPAKGLKVHADAFMVLTTKGGDFTKIQWSPAD